MNIEEIIVALAKKLPQDENGFFYLTVVDDSNAEMHDLIFMPADPDENPKPDQAIFLEYDEATSTSTQSVRPLAIALEATDTQMILMNRDDFAAMANGILSEDLSLFQPQ